MITTYKEAMQLLDDGYIEIVEPISDEKLVEITVEDGVVWIVELIIN